MANVREIIDHEVNQKMTEINTAYQKAKQRVDEMLTKKPGGDAARSEFIPAWLSERLRPFTSRLWPHSDRDGRAGRGRAGSGNSSDDEDEAVAALKALPRPSLGPASPLRGGLARRPPPLTRQDTEELDLSDGASRLAAHVSALWKLALLACEGLAVLALLAFLLVAVFMDDD